MPGKSKYQSLTDFSIQKNKTDSEKGKNIYRR